MNFTGLQGCSQEEKMADIKLARLGCTAVVRPAARGAAGLTQTTLE